MLLQPPKFHVPGLFRLLITAWLGGLTDGFSAQESYNEPLRPQFHFTAPKGWLNDPNGPVFYGGEYHLFYQHNPNGPNWISELSWGHATSSDLLHWRNLPPVLPPTPVSAGKTAGSWSGTAAIDWNNRSGFQDGTNKPIVVAWTAAGFGQCIAFSNDRGSTFTKWTNNPVIPFPTTGEARDPKIFWHDPTRRWVLVLWQSKVKGFTFYASHDLKQWTALSSVPGFFECPDFFEIAVDGDANNKKWILWDASSKYLIGRFDGTNFNAEAGPFRLDGGRSFYAAQTWSGVPASDGRRLGIGWMRDGKFPGMAFNQQMGIPFELTLKTTAAGLRLAKVPVRELARLRYQTAKKSNFSLRQGETFTLDSSDIMDIEADGELAESAEVEFSIRGQSIRCTPKAITSGKDTGPLPENSSRLKLRLLVDRTSMEVFANDGLASLTRPITPPAESQRLAVHAVAGPVKLNSLRVHKLQSVWQGSDDHVDASR